MKKSWIEEARRRGKLKITDNHNCPFCNPEHETCVPTKVNACEKHQWVSRKWYEGIQEIR